MSSVKPGHIVVAIDNDGTNVYGVRVPDIPGCFSAGDSLESALVNVVEAIKDHLELAPECFPFTRSSTKDIKSDIEYEGCYITEVAIEIDF